MKDNFVNPTDTCSLTKMTGKNKFDDLLSHLGTGPWNMLYFIASSYCESVLHALVPLLAHRI